MEDLSEKEQLEAMRSWWQENGRYVIGGIVLGIAMLAGWNYWQSSQKTAQLGASALYESVLENVASGNVEQAETAATDLYDNYARTVYAAHARLAMARLYMDKGRDQDATNVLREVLDARDNPQLELIARLRLARVLLYQDKAAEVIKLLEGQIDSTFAPRFSEALGDAYVALGKFDDAAEAYAVAVSEDENLQTVDRTLVQMKINDLPEPGEVVAVDESMRAPTEAAATPAEPGSNEGDQ